MAIGYTEIDFVNSSAPALNATNMNKIDEALKNACDILDAETVAGRALVEAADADAQRTALGLGDSATKNVGTGAGDVAAGNAPAGAVTTHESTYAHANLPTADEKAALTADYANLNKIVPTQEAVAQAVRDINELERTIQQGQGATIDQDDIGSVALDVRATGRANPTVEGLTATNRIRNGNFANGISQWLYAGASLPTVSDGIVSITGTAGVGTQFYQTNVMSVVEGDVLWLHARAMVTNSNATFLRLALEFAVGASVTVKEIATPIINTWYDLDARYVIPAGSSGAMLINIRTFYADATGKVTQIDGNYGVSAFNLTAIYGAGNEPSEADCAKIFSYFDGTDSVALPARVRSVGKNLWKTITSLDDLTRNPYSDSPYAISGLNEEKFSFYNGKIKTPVTPVASRLAFTLKLKPNTQYTISFKTSEFTGALYRLFGSERVYSSEGYSRTFTTDNEGYINWGISDSKYPVYVLDSTKTGIEIYDIQLELGSTATAYEPYEDTALYISDTADLRSVPAITDEVKVVNGEVVKVQNVSELKTLTASDFVSIDTSRVNVDAVNIATFAGGVALSAPPAEILSLDIPFFTGASDNVENIGKFSRRTLNDTSILIIIPKGMSLATARTTYGGTRFYYQLATPIITPLLTSGILQAKRSGTVYFEPWYEGSHQTNADGEITLPFAGTVEKVYGYDESMVEYELDPSEYALVGTTLTITGATLNEVFYVELSRSEPLSPLMNVNVLNNLVVPTTVNAAAYTVLDGDHTLLVSYSATGACAITIPSALIAKYIRLVIKDSGGSANVNNITIGTEGTEKIDGADTYVINTAKGKVVLASDGANLFVVG